MLQPGRRKYRGAQGRRKAREGLPMGQILGAASSENLAPVRTHDEERAWGVKSKPDTEEVRGENVRGSPHGVRAPEVN
jgi:hypothetical protein